jgi:hypothetical protein
MMPPMARGPARLCRSTPAANHESLRGIGLPTFALIDCTRKR